jgi:hypothetical protein
MASFERMRRSAWTSTLPDRITNFAMEPFSEDKRSIEVSVRPRTGSAAICSRCHQTAPGYDQLAERRFEFIPLRASSCSSVHHAARGSEAHIHEIESAPASRLRACFLLPSVFHPLLLLCSPVLNSLIRRDSTRNGRPTASPSRVCSRRSEERHYDGSARCDLKLSCRGIASAGPAFSTAELPE